MYCKGGALDGRRAWPRRGVLYCCGSGAGAELAMAAVVAMFGQGVVGVCSSRSMQYALVAGGCAVAGGASRAVPDIDTRRGLTMPITRVAVVSSKTLTTVVNSSQSRRGRLEYYSLPRVYRRLTFCRKHSSPGEVAQVVHMFTYVSVRCCPICGCPNICYQAHPLVCRLLVHVLDTSCTSSR